MSSAATQPLDQPFNPEEYRMTVGEHLEELRKRFVMGLIGFAIAAVFCFIFGDRVVSYFCQPLVNALEEAKVNPQIYITSSGDAFMVFMQISLICAAAISGPWMVYQLWLFIAAGLYSHERKYVTKYVPVSIGLLIGGMLFVYFLVLPWTLSFFIGFAAKIPLYPGGGPKDAPRVATTLPLAKVPLVPGDPITAANGDMWYDTTQHRMKMMVDGMPRVVPFGPNNLIAPHITLPDYIDLVLGMLIVFGLAFQLPLVVLALLRIGIVELETMKGARRYVYFAMTVIAAVITPGDVITATLALIIPLCMLYEVGILLFVMGNRKKSTPAEAA